MGLDKKEIKKIADLAKLELSDEELESYKDQLSGVLDYVKKINTLDMASVKESLSGAEDSSVGPRPDEVGDSYPEIIGLAQRRKGPLVEAPNVFEK